MSGDQKRPAGMKRAKNDQNKDDQDKEYQHKQYQHKESKQPQKVSVLKQKKSNQEIDCLNKGPSKQKNLNQPVHDQAGEKDALHTQAKVSENKNSPFAQKDTEQENSTFPDKPLLKGRPPVYGALDLGTNNCRLLLARPSRKGFQIVDAFSRIIRLGEGVSETGKLSKQAMDRTIDALQVCATKMNHNRVSRSHLVATQACRSANNSQEFIDKVKRKTGLELDVICQETEAKLAVSGCITLIDETCDYALIFDIGGGSSELIWLDVAKTSDKEGQSCIRSKEAIVAWTSLPVGVVTLAEKFGGQQVSAQDFSNMIAYVKTLLADFAKDVATKIDLANAKLHFLGTSGTVTTIAGVHLSLDVYDRQQVDGLWMESQDVEKISHYLRGLDYEDRAKVACIGRERADLVLAGCAILQALLETWPTPKLRVADRGLREGILAQLMTEDGFLKPGQCWTSSPKRYKARTKHSRKRR